ncbi:hypothetical protein [Streptomyces albidoflavus]|nr:hypothetical protein [Streptomyces albidoflavus]
MQNVDITEPPTAEIPALITEPVDEITLGRQNFNDRDKDMWFES